MEGVEKNDENSELRDAVLNYEEHKDDDDLFKKVPKAAKKEKVVENAPIYKSSESDKARKIKKVH